jgi:hypothetical protein
MKRIVPGMREAGTLTRFRPAADVPEVLVPLSTMDVATIAEKRREGGGSPRARRSLDRRSLWTRLLAWRSARAQAP